MREHWNWGAGVVVSLFVVAVAFTVNGWASRLVTEDLGVGNDDFLYAAILLSAGAGVALIATFLLSARSAGAASVFALLAGVTTSVGVFWDSLRNWNQFTDQRWEVQASAWAITAIPLVLGILALGLRRKDRRAGTDF